MLRKPNSKRIRPKPKAVLRLPDLDQAKSAVLNSLTSADAQRGYRHAIEEFAELIVIANTHRASSGIGVIRRNHVGPNPIARDHRHNSSASSGAKPHCSSWRRCTYSRVQ